MAATVALCYSAPMKPFQVPSAFTTTFTLEYGVSEADMRRLYENAKRDQWNASQDIPWTDAFPSDGRVIAAELMHGEQGALLACSQMVDIVQGADQKFFQATQVVDEARHNEVLSRYLTDRLEGLTYPMPSNEKDLFDSILSESRWYLKTIALQLVAETFAVALFKMMSESAVDPVLGTICKRILQDESRHMGFGMLSLPRVVNEASETERRELEDYTCFALEKTLMGFFPLEAYQDVGFTPRQIDEVKRYRRETAAANDYAPFRKYFKKDMHGAMVSNLARLGLLTDRVRPRLEKLGVTLPAS